MGLIFLPEVCCFGCTRCVFLGGFLSCKRKRAGVIRENSSPVLTSTDLCGHHSVPVSLDTVKHPKIMQRLHRGTLTGAGPELDAPSCQLCA